MKKKRIDGQPKGQNNTNYTFGGSAKRQKHGTNPTIRAMQAQQGQALGNTCFNCRQFGHYAKNCCNPKVQKMNANIVCYGCNLPGHKNKDCPMASQQ